MNRTGIVWDLSGDREDAYKLGNARFSKGELLNHFESRRELTDAITDAIEQSGMDGCPRCAKMLEAWPDCPRKLTALEPDLEPNRQTFWFGAEFAPAGNQVWTPR